MMPLKEKLRIDPDQGGKMGQVEGKPHMDQAPAGGCQESAQHAVNQKGVQHQGDGGALLTGLQCCGLIGGLSFIDTLLVHLTALRLRVLVQI